MKALERESVHANRERTSFGVVLVDLDGFKLVNDRHGYIAGDRVLGEAARRMRTAVRVYDLVGRYGGEEFLIVCPGCHEAEVVAIAERVRMSLARAPIEIAPGEAISTTLSLGVAMGGTHGIDDPIRLIKSADTALYRAKNRGGNCVELAIPDIER